jgi:hypothetical protein
VEFPKSVASVCKKLCKNEPLIANRRYVLASDVADFNRTLSSDEFAGNVSKSLRARSITSKETSGNILGPSKSSGAEALYLLALGIASSRH